jgi:hypothetical protein
MSMRSIGGGGGKKTLYRDSTMLLFDETLFIVETLTVIGAESMYFLIIQIDLLSALATYILYIVVLAFLSSCWSSFCFAFHSS